MATTQEPTVLPIPPPQAHTSTPTRGAAIIDVNPTPAPQGAIAVSSNLNAHKKFSEPLFGPSIGSVSTGPSWTLSSEKWSKNGTLVAGSGVGGPDELTSEVVGRWVERSKQPSHPTTTLQALVNLKRPTLRLAPLSIPSDDPNTHHHPSTNPHAITFTYDCDAPLCSIQINVHIPKTHPFVAYFINSNGNNNPNEATSAAAITAGDVKEVDADSPLSHYPPPTLPSTSSSALARVKIFEVVKEGGFGRKVVVDDGAGVELGVWEGGLGGGGAKWGGWEKWIKGARVSKVTEKSGSVKIRRGGMGDEKGGVEGKEKVEVEVVEASESPVDFRGSSPAPGSAPALNSNSGTSTPNGAGAVTPNRPASATGPDHKKRFSSLHFFKKHHGSGSGAHGHGHGHSQSREVAGPALAVVDAAAEAVHEDGEAAVGPPSTGAAATGATATPGSNANNASGKKKSTTGTAAEEDTSIKMTIRLVALDEDGKELDSANEQVTFLSVGRFGPLPVAGTSAAATSPTSVGGTVGGANGTAGVTGGGEKGGVERTEGKEDEKEDTRPWVVKVVKREATIGPHTFHLHEIYGLSSSSSDDNNAAPTAPHPDSHTYPPTTHVDEPSSEASECLLCLSSPREVVLLPCRHLVACKECALNMVEFGAGGSVVAEGEGEAGGVAGGGGAPGAAAGGAVAGANMNPTAGVDGPAAQRRRKKAKGWFCPVCRQPYTSMLRLSTSAPPLPSPTSLKEKNAAADGDGDGDNSGTEDEEDGPGGVNGASNTSRTNASANGETQGGFLRGGFLRGLSVSNVGSALGLTASRSGQGQSQPGDVENQVGTRV